MARPLKNSADWFPHDAKPTTKERDIIEYLCSNFGQDRGYAWYFRMKEYLCGKENYQIENFTRLKKDRLARTFGMPEKIFAAICAASIEVGGHEEKNGAFYSPWLNQALEPLNNKREKDRARVKCKRVIAATTGVSSLYSSNSNNISIRNTKREVADLINETDIPQSQAENRIVAAKTKQPKRQRKAKIRVVAAKTGEYEELARRIFDGICANNEVYRRIWTLPDGEPNNKAREKWGKWVPDIRLLIEKDGVPADAVHFILAWIFGGEVRLNDGSTRVLEPWVGERGFNWHENIQSGRKLREKFPQLVAAAKRSMTQQPAMKGKPSYSTKIYEY